MRDIAIGGLAALLVRTDWRSSDVAPAVSDAVMAGLHDDNPLVRMRAAEGVLALHADQDSEQRAASIGGLLLAEDDDAVRRVLLRALEMTAATAPAVVDDVLAQLHKDRDPGDAEDDKRGDVTADLLTYLALVAETPFASTTVEGWCNQAPTRAPAVGRFAHCARRYLAPPGGKGQDRAFALLGAAAEASAARWLRDPSERLSGAELSAAQLEELKGAVHVCRDIAQQIYFASGAYDDKGDPVAERAVPDRFFADLALPVLKMCASTGVPQCVHPAVETVVFLAPLDESSALRFLADAVPSDSEYAGDSLAGDVVAAYLDRLLAEQRPLVLFDQDGSEAFRRLLATFAGAGNQEALALAYTFADTFR